ncbi:uncharacterized protein BO87DRAFT_315863 [Aspergillus neoniger CBS 115656]|uniref:Uncharacterized protein n=1 Tax=Aspergillus neoniger (strain CBS 115656) TaxID=1448310 RepID=A0A318YAQ6_ASPNB|nr:hypothetical protein BO87DRAFT_315863 [Aspergillus neoniger CBS 115656]PYH31129.1 hypothetical protein BO87DRAFT_315863 [Aspergillus neoniger CBS 115656]
MLHIILPLMERIWQWYVSLTLIPDPPPLASTHTTKSIPFKPSRTERVEEKTIHKKEQPKPTPQKTLNLSLREQKQNASLQEALSCTSCTITRIPKDIYYDDRIKGIYDASRDPPFLTPGLTTTTEDKEIPPDEIPPTPKEGKGNKQEQSPTYTHLLTPTQEQSYSTQLQIYLSHDPTNDHKFAKYLVDYHIHIHYLLRRSMLGLCRDVTDLYEMKDWMKRMHPVNHEDEGVSVSATGIYTPQPQLGPSQNLYSLRSQNYRKRQNRQQQSYQSPFYQPPQRQHLPRSSLSSSVSSSTEDDRPSDWPGDSNRQMKYQVKLWDKGARMRRKRYKESQARWAVIQEERARQQEMIMMMMRSKRNLPRNTSPRMVKRGSGGVKVRLYCSTQVPGVSGDGLYYDGKRRFLREVEVEEMAFGEVIR